jgi:hypothetical protein
VVWAGYATKYAHFWGVHTALTCPLRGFVKRFVQVLMRKVMARALFAPVLRSVALVGYLGAIFPLTAGAQDLGGAFVKSLATAAQQAGIHKIGFITEPRR